jgi:hypothetical protein
MCQYLSQEIKVFVLLIIEKTENYDVDPLQLR